MDDKLISIKEDLVSSMTQAVQESFEEYIRDEDSSEAYYNLELETARMHAFKGLLERHFGYSDFPTIYSLMKETVLKNAEKYCTDYGYEITVKHLKFLDDILSVEK